MKRFIFFTKTYWHEPPRIRHQLAWLLRDAGYDVIFFEKPFPPWQHFINNPTVSCQGIQLCRYNELLHHKLRISRLLYKLNALWVLRSINRFIGSLDITAGDIIVNFNYDYGFLRDVFPHNRIITIINDNFISQAILGWKKPLALSLEKTCSISDHVLAVSNPLLRQLDQFCDPQLFLPWADRAYTPPSFIQKRDTFLFWGFINDRIDYDLILRWAEELELRRPHMRFLFVGPLQIKQNEIKLLEGKQNIGFLPPSDLDDLPLDRIIAGIIPYKSAVPRMDAITLSNKALQILARGLPLIIHGMPDFYEAPFIMRLDGAYCVDIADKAIDNFYSFQPQIKEFVSEHSATARLKQFLSYAD